MTSGSIDLDGGIVTVGADETLYVFQITDTSAGHDGEFIAEAGSTIIWDDALGGDGSSPGFTVEADDITITVNGTATHPVTFKSESSSPTNKWTLPQSPHATLTEGDFYGYTGSHTTVGWIDNRCEWEYDATLWTTTYCTPAELAMLTGSELADIDLAGLINHAEREVDAILSLAGLGGGSGNIIKSACLKLAEGHMLTRYRIDGTKPKSLTIGELSMSDDIDTAIATLRAEAFTLIDQFTQQQRTGTDWYVLKV